MRLRPTIRLRLTALYAGVLVACSILLLGVTWWLVTGHLERTLPAPLAEAAGRDLLARFGLAVAGAALIAGGLGWLTAGRALAPVRRITATARRVSEERLDERIALDGPRDELHELAATLDAMLDRLQAAVESQRRFVANASHELRTPLTVIRAEAEVTLADPDATVEELREMGRVVIETSDRTEALLDGLLVLALSNRGARRHAPVDLQALARRAQAAAAAEAAGEGVGLHVATAPATVYGDEALLERMIGNLLENAIRHNRRSGVAELAVLAVDGRAIVRVRNDGPDVPPQALERLTAPFERLDRTGGRRGSGLGLSIVRAVAEAHGGALRLSARPGGGLEVEVALPAAVAAAPPSASAPEPLTRI